MIRKNLSYLPLIFVSLFYCFINNQCPAKANPVNTENILPLENNDRSQHPISRQFLQESLDLLDQLDDNSHKVIILNNIALKYIQIGDKAKATEILEQSFIITQQLKDEGQKITLLTEIAKRYQLMGNKEEATEIIDQTLTIANNIEDPNLRATLIFEIALQYELIEETAKAQVLYEQSQNLIAESRRKFPFREKPRSVKFGLSGSVSSFRDTTALLGFNLDYYKQWQRQDYWFSGNFFFDYDSSRSVNNVRPGGRLASLYRYHFIAEWSFFNYFFATANNDLFAPENDDEDITAIAEVSVGASYNIWRGRDNQEFWDFQMGIGSRYEYDYINFELVRNQAEPILHLGLVGRSIAWGKAKVDQFFILSPDLIDLDNYIVTSQTKLSIPLTKRWSFANRLFIRYRNQQILEDNPKLQFVFSTGFDYKF